MKGMRLAVFALYEVVATAAAHAQTDRPATPPMTTIDSSALAGSARASKVIGSKVYQRDTVVGQIEDVLITLDRGTVTAVILSVGGFLGLREKLIALPVNQIIARRNSRPS
jgi:sporulation protein YlmC with PRC-barrel domain